ncbi:hypothetical protein EZV62_017159 [Acer yangbiense]|uniref:Uncharacterized protein n=1 Tax=Acer yangbiense TaxID=1000413 RepID=A0A5C7HI02_9ROSI|nr:hypothetical protein EZV62_017159 [Acer yangbiense]
MVLYFFCAWVHAYSPLMQLAIEECFSTNDIIFANRPLLPSKRISQYNYTTLGAPYGHQWRNLRRFIALEIFSAKRLQMSSEIHAKEAKFMIKHLYKRSLEGVWKVDVKSFFSMLDFNIMMKMVAGKKCFEEEELDFDKITKGKLVDLEQTFGPSVNMALGGETSRPIIEVLLNLQESEPEFYANDVVKGIIQAMLIAGTHTTVITLDSVVSQMIAHPEAFKKASETLRLGLVKVLPADESSKDCMVGGYHIPKGTQLLVKSWAVHSDPELWIEPDRFKPGRFLQSEVQEKGGCKFIPFGLGRMVCPGEGLGMRVMALSLGTLIQCFDWKEVKEDQSQAPVKTNPKKAEKS